MTEPTTVQLPGGARQPVKLTNLSAGGARIATLAPFGARFRLTLTVPLGAGQRKDVSAEVVYCKREPHALHFASGLSFLGAGRDGLDHIAAFIEEERRRRRGAGEMWRQQH